METEKHSNSHSPVSDAEDASRASASTTVNSGLAASTVQERPSWRDDYNWAEAFAYASIIRTATGCDPAPFTLEDVASVIAKSEGENDEQSWMMVGQLKDGRYFFLEAWCDYTGWDCQAGGDAQVAHTLAALNRYGMTEDARERLSMPLPPDAIAGAA